MSSSFIPFIPIFAFLLVSQGSDHVSWEDQQCNEASDALHKARMALIPHVFSPPCGSSQKLFSTMNTLNQRRAVLLEQHAVLEKELASARAHYSAYDRMWDQRPSFLDCLWNQMKQFGRSS